MPPYLKPAFVAVASLLSFIAAAPSTLHKTAGVALWFIVADTMTGLACARVSGELTSSAFRKKLNSKLICYAGTLSLAAGMAVMAGSWAWLIAGCYGVMASEAISIAENLSGIVRSGGPAMAPIAALLDKIITVFASKGDKKDNGPSNG